MYAANRLTSVTNGGNASSYAYNGLGDRLSQTVNSSTTNYALDVNAGLTQVLADGTNTYLYGNGRIGELQPGGFVYHQGDALGSVRQLVDGGANVTLARNFEPYGSVLNSAGTGSTVMAYTGEVLDSTGLQFNRARYFASSVGRFVTADGWSGSYNQSFASKEGIVDSRQFSNSEWPDYTRPSTLNRWSYAEGNVQLRKGCRMISGPRLRSRP